MMPSKQMLRGIAAFCVAVLAAWPALAEQNPVTFNGCPEDPGWPTAQQGAGRDIVVHLPHDRVCQPNKSAGGKLISVLGGTAQNPAKSVTIPDGGKIINKWGQGNRQTDKGAALLRFEHVDGPILVEGVHLDARGTCEDLINMVYVTGRTTLTVRNMYGEGAGHCGKGGTHGDWVQNQGWGRPADAKAGGGYPLPTLIADHVVVRVMGQGLWGTPRTTGHGFDRVDLSDVTFIGEDRLKNPDPTKGVGWVIGWKDPLPGALVPAKGVKLSSVYIDPNGQSVRYPSSPPPAGMKNGCAIYGTAAGKVDGTWCWGPPPGGLPVRPEAVGLDYTGGGTIPDPRPKPDEPSALPDDGQPSKVVYVKDADGRNVLMKLRRKDAKRIARELDGMAGSQQ